MTTTNSGRTSAKSAKANLSPAIKATMAERYNALDLTDVGHKFTVICQAMKEAEEAGLATARVLVDHGVRPEYLSYDARFNAHDAESQVDDLLLGFLMDIYNTQYLSPADLRILKAKAKTLNDDQRKAQSRLRSERDNFIRYHVCRNMVALIESKGDTTYTDIAETNAAEKERIAKQKAAEAPIITFGNMAPSAEHRQILEALIENAQSLEGGIKQIPAYIAALELAITKL